MKRMAAILVSGLALTACDDGGSTLIPSFEAPEVDECTQAIPRTFQVYFVVNVSLSMSDFLEALRDELTTFADSFPTTDVNGDRLLVDYYVVGYVNDFGFFPQGAPRMTSSLAVAQALEDARLAGFDNRNIDGSDNSERDENLLDAIDAALANGTDADRVLFIIATQDNFRNRGSGLAPNFVVQTEFGDISQRLQDLREEKALVYAFTNGQVEGLDRNFELQPPIATEANLNLNALLETSAVGAILGDIAQQVSCTELDAASN